MGKQRILFILPAMSAGGAERVLITLANHLPQDLFDRHFLSVAPDGPMRSWLYDDIPFETLDVKNVRYALPKLYKAIKRIQPDIVISTMAHMNYALLLLRPLFPQMRLIVREAITPSYFFSKNAFSPLLKLFYKGLYPQADLVISPAQAIIDEFQTLVGLPLTRQALLYNPVDAERIRAPKVANIVNDDRRHTVHFVCAGRLHPQKGFDRLIESLPWLRHDQAWELTILGDGEERPYLEQLIKANGLEDKVKLAGHLSQPWPIIAAADCFLLPSRFEGLPNVVLEALTVGTPVIATHESGGIAEIAARAPQGAVTVVQDMPGFIHAMEKISANPSVSYRPTLLPQEFALNNVVQRFTRLLQGIETDYLLTKKWSGEDAATPRKSEQFEQHTAG
jgi:glycosyltransferase involved in cell wall biosynthesis